VLIIRFLTALNAGYSKGMVEVFKDEYLMIRDLSHENFIGIFWLINAAFWCFGAVLVGLLPAMLLGWTLHLPNFMLMFFTTAVTIVLGIPGLVVSVLAASFILIGCIGAVSFSRKMGSSQYYKLDGHTVLRLDNTVLTIIHPGMPEAMVDLQLLDQDDQAYLLVLMQERGLNVQYMREKAGVSVDKAELEAALV
jgi:hypothetical protein